jgi:hypothetical protein
MRASRITTVVLMIAAGLTGCGVPTTTGQQPPDMAKSGLPYPGATTFMTPDGERFDPPGGPFTFACAAPTPNLAWREHEGGMELISSSAEVRFLKPPEADIATHAMGVGGTWWRSHPSIPTQMAMYAIVRCGGAAGKVSEPQARPVLAPPCWYVSVTTTGAGQFRFFIWTTGGSDPFSGVKCGK